MNDSRPRERPEEDERYMELALREAARALEQSEVPVGAVIVAAGTVIGRAHNQVRMLRDPTAHAEMLAITQAAAALENERLASATLYVTLEPCAMCAGAIVLARLGRVVYGAKDPRAGACGSVLDVLAGAGGPRPRVADGIRANEAGALLRDFFQARRGRADAGE